MSDKLILELINLVDRINNDINYDDDWDINVGLTLEYYTDSMRIKWLGITLWDYDVDCDGNIMDIETEIKKEMRRSKLIISGI